MASIRPINLAAPSTTIGAMPPELIAAMQRQQAMQSPGQSMAQQTQDFTREARSQALIDALDAGMTGPLHGGGWGEALARFGESYLRTRSGARGHERDLRAEALARDQDQEDRKLRNRSALAEAQSAGEAYIMTLPPAQQVQARMQMLLDPEGFVASMRGGEWQGGQGYTHAWRTRPDGSIELGGELPLRPFAPRSSSSTQHPDVPDGFVLD